MVIVIEINYCFAIKSTPSETSNFVKISFEKKFYDDEIEMNIPIYISKYIYTYILIIISQYEKKPLLFTSPCESGRSLKIDKVNH